MTNSTTKPLLLGAGYSLYFDSTRDFFSIDSQIWVKKTQATICIWVYLEIDRSSIKDYDPLNMHIFGHPFASGPRLYLTRTDDNMYAIRGKDVYWSNLAAKQCERTLPGQDVLTQRRWHHLAMTVSPKNLVLYLDFKPVYSCKYTGERDISYADVEQGSVVNLGMHNPKENSLRDGFAGRLDHLVYLNESLNVGEIVSISKGDIPGHLIKGVMLNCDFNKNMRDYSSNQLVWRTDSGRNPNFEESRANITGEIIAVISRSKPKGKNTPLIAPLNFFGGYNTHEKSRFEIILMQACDGVFYLYDDKGKRLFSHTNRESISIEKDTALYFHPYQLSTGSYKLLLHEFSESRVQNVSIEFTLIENNRPIAGSAGYAIKCDGVDDFLFSKNFYWPLGNFSNGKFGGYPITIEFWVKAGPSPDQIAKVLSVGNGEMVEAWVDAKHPLRKTGRFYVMAPNEDGKIVASIGSTTYVDYRMKEYLGSWVHVAITHDQASNNTACIYVNGKKVANITHDFIGVGQPSLNNRFSEIPSAKKVQGLSLCDWAFWGSGSYDGTLDELRIWNYSRNQEEIHRDMMISLTGKEDGLFAYYRFDEMNYDLGYAEDSSTNDFHLEYGGCAPCTVDYMGFMPSTKYSYVCDPIKSNETIKGLYSPPYKSPCGELVCQASASDKSSKDYINGIVYGGYPCYEMEGDVPITQRENRRRPKIVISTAPIFSKVYEQFIRHDEASSNPYTILLNGTDMDTVDLINLTRRIVKFPDYGELTYKKYNAVSRNYTRVYLSQNRSNILEANNYAVEFKPERGRGGRNITFLSYVVSDGLLDSEEAVVPISIYCDKGHYVNQTSNVCTPCPKGTFSSKRTFDTSCKPCRKGLYQNSTGQSQCLKCEGHQYSLDGIHCNSCEKITTPHAPTAKNVGEDCPTIINRATEDFDILLELEHKFDNYGVKSSDIEIPHRLSIFSDPIQGELYEYIGVDKKGNRMIGRDLRHKTPARRIVSQFVKSVIAECQQVPVAPIKSIIGHPQLTSHVSHPTYAWGTCERPHKYSYNNNSVDVQFEKKIFITGLTIYENFNPGALKLVEAYLYSSNSWEILWVEIPKFTGPRYNVLQIQDICPPSEQTDRIRVTLEVLNNGKPSEIDAIQITGVENFENIPFLPIFNRNHQVIFRYKHMKHPSESNGKKIPLYDSFYYRIKRCTSEGVTQRTASAPIYLGGTIRSDTQAQQSFLIVVIATFVSMFLVFVAFVLLYGYWSKGKNKELEEQLISVHDTIPQSAIVSPKDVSVGQELGRGASGVVYLGKFRGVSVAIKQLSFTRNSFDSVKVEVEREAKRMCELRHPNIVIFMGCCLEKHNPFILSQYCEHGSLYDILHNEELDLPWICRLRLAVGAIRGLLYLHGGTRPYIHRDVKSLNILVDESWTAKLADFGTLRVVEALNGISTQVDRLMTFEFGTIRWTAPELLLARQLMNKGSNDDALRFPYTEAVDIYSFGVVLWEIATRKLPYNHIHFMYAVEEAVLNGYVLELPENMQDSIPSSYAEIMYECLKWNPENRPTAAEILSVLENLLEDEEMVWDSTSDGYGRDGWSVSTRGVYRPTLVHSMNSSV